MRISDWSSDVCSSDLSQGHTLVVTSSKDGPVSVLEKELADAEVVISQPFWPAYLTAERIAKAPKLKLALTAGIGSDHVDLDAAIKAGITVAEVTFCNSIRSEEHTSELQSLMRTSYAVFCLKKKKTI